MTLCSAKLIFAERVLVIGHLIPILYVVFCQDQAAEAMEVFDELLESEVSVVVPHIKSVMEFCMQVNIVSKDGVEI